MIAGSGVLHYISRKELWLSNTTTLVVSNNRR